MRVRGVSTNITPIIHVKNLLLNHSCPACDYYRTSGLAGLVTNALCIFRDDLPIELTCDKWSDHDQTSGIHKI